MIYDDTHWECLRSLREQAMGIMIKLEQAGIEPFVYGSVSRGDVGPSSDIDIIIPQLIPSYRIELAIGQYEYREVVQATPSSILKGHLHINDKVVITFPLFKMMSREHDFYRWGGLLSIKQLRADERVPGVDKRLLLIEPTKSGHVETGVIGNEHAVARALGVSVDLAYERVRVLTRRSSVGRTGVFLTREVPDGVTVEEFVGHLRDSIPALRRTINRRGG